MPQSVDLTKDADFMAAPPDQQSKYLASIDPDFAAASPSDKLAYLGHITGKNYAPAAAPTGQAIGAPEGVVGRSIDELRNMGSAALNSKFPYVHPFDALSAAASAGEGEIQHYAPESVAELALGGKAVGKPYGTSSGLVNNPMTTMLLTPEMEAVNLPEASAFLPETQGPALSAVRNGIEAVGNAVRDPLTGKLRPVTREAARAVGAATGYESGKAVGHPMEGMLVGGYLGPEAADALLPASSDFANEQKAQMLMRRGREQDTLDRRAAIQARQQTALAKANAPQPPTPFQGVTYEAPTQGIVPRGNYATAGQDLALRQSEALSPAPITKPFQGTAYQLPTQGSIPSGPYLTPGQQLATRQASLPVPIEPTPFRPTEPIVGTPQDWQDYDQALSAHERQMEPIRAEASDAGTFSAARGKVGKKYNYQERIGSTFDPYSPTR